MPRTQKKQKKILIVEDEMPIAHTLQLKLENQGFDTLHATDGDKALELLKNHDIDLMLLDIIMPNKDGFEVLQSMKKNIPVCVLTNLCQEEDGARCKKMGAYEYFIKSETPLSTIVRHIHELLQ
jgi:DNA-binding response OmpR family regulator